jgi:4-hydroxy-tetrahydrodipicolinate synthase
MSQRQPFSAVRGIVHVPVTPFTPDNKVDLDTFARVIEFLLRQKASSLCVNLHLAESLNLTLDERKALAKAAVEVVAGRVPIIVHVSTPGTDQAIELARHAEQIGADCVMAIAPYYWKPSQEQLTDHFAAIMTATALPFIAYNSPTIMDGVGIAPATLTPLMQRFPQFIGLKEASHNWEKYLELGRAAKLVRADFGLFVGTEWMLPSLTLGGTACMSIFGGIAPNFINALYDAVMSGRLRRSTCNTNSPSSTRSPRSNIRRRPRRCGRSWAARLARRGCPTGRSWRSARRRSDQRSKASGSSIPNRMAGSGRLGPIEFSATTRT